MAGVQPIIGNGKVFVGTMAGILHAMDLDTLEGYPEPFCRNECPFAFPTMSAEVFTAKALILHEPAEKLTSYLDIPWCKADLFYIQKLVLCIEACGNVTWQNEYISQ